MTTLKNKLSICFCDVVDIPPDNNYISLDGLPYDPEIDKIKRFNIRNENERELLFNYFSAIPDIYKIKKTRKFWEEKRQEFIKRYNLNICLNAFTVNFSRYRRGYPDND
jgi:hypothetical protein